MKHRQSQRQQLLQKMSLTPQMRQSLQLLNMSIKDLNDYIETALSNNPFLQKIIDKKDAGKGHKTSYSSIDSRESSHESNLKDVENPRQALLTQLRLTGLDDKTFEIAEYLIYEMDDNGYISTDPEEAARDLSCAMEDVDKALEVIQGMEPAGIGAADVRECLQLQLKRQDKENSIEYTIVESFLNELAQNDAGKISKVLKADIGKVREAMANIKKLNPRPASTILATEAAKVIPELKANIKDAKVRLELNRERLPNLKLYNPYESNLDIIKDPEARKFLKENINSAKTLIDNLKRREETVSRVADYILTAQREALSKKGRSVKSLTIKDVAAGLDFHPSTISRAVSNKYIEINGDVVPINSLLSHGLKKENGEIESKASVKHRIESIVKAEDATQPLSDSAIKDSLAKDGIKIERRTIAKYRKALRILPVHLRKKVKTA